MPYEDEGASYVADDAPENVYRHGFVAIFTKSSTGFFIASPDSLEDILAGWRGTGFDFAFKRLHGTVMHMLRADVRGVELVTPEALESDERYEEWRAARADKYRKSFE